jgi:hypothetical protein
MFNVSEGWSDGMITFVRLSFGDLHVGVVREMYDVTHDAVMASFEQRVVTERHPYDGSVYAQCTDDYTITLRGEAFETWRVHEWRDGGDGPVDLYYARSRYRTSMHLEPLGSRRLELLAPGIHTFDTGAPVPAEGYVAYIDGYTHSRLHVSEGWRTPLTFDAIEPDEYFGEDLVSAGDTVAWHSVPGEIESPSLVQAWSPAKGYRKVAARDRKIFASTLDVDGLTWIESDWSGPYWSLAKLTNATLMRMTEGGTPVEIARDLGDVGVFVVSGGGYAAAMVSTKVDPPPNRAELVVARLADKKVWRLGTGPGTLKWTRPSSIDAHVLVVGATDAFPFDRERPSRRLYVLDVASLDELAETLPTTP